MELFIPTENGIPVITETVTLALTPEHLNNMSKDLRELVLNYGGDKTKWVPPKNFLGRVFRGSTESHAWCPGQMRVFASSGLLAQREYTRCNVCGRMESYLLDY